MTGLKGFSALVLLSLMGLSQGLQFYNHLNFGDLLFEDIPTIKCKNIPAHHRNKVSSVKNEVCLVLYSHPDCEGRSFILDAGETPLLEYFNDALTSFEACEEVDTILNEASVKFFRDHHYEKFELENTLQPGCSNLPSWAINMISSVDTEACVVLYSHENCQGSRFIVEKGSGWELVGFNDDADSFRPCDDRDTLLKPMLSSVIKSFKVSIVEEEGEIPPSRREQMTATSTFFNNGSATIRQEYVVSKTMKEIVEVTRSHSLIKTHDVNVSAGVTFDFSFGVPIFARGNIQASLGLAYKYHENETWNEEEKYFSEYQNEMKVTQEIAIPACTNYEVSSYVDTMRDYPVEYVATVELRGRKGRKVMTVEEIRGAVDDGFTVVGQLDEETVVATTKGKMITDFAVTTVVTGNGAPIEDCYQFYFGRGQ